jgi:HAMP domain-containing protein
MEGLLEEERRHTQDLQKRLDAALKAAADRDAEFNAKLADAAAVASNKEAKLKEQILSLENELRRLPHTASEVADIQCAVYGIMSSEAEEIRKILDEERAEAEEFRRRHAERADRLLERRLELLKRAGGNIEDMTRRALIDRPEDPRTVRLRRELEELKREDERKVALYEDEISHLKAALADMANEKKRVSEKTMDITQLQLEIQSLREKLQSREKELMQ